MKWTGTGWKLSKGLLLLWPILLVPGLMSLAASTRGLWSTCTYSWFTGFLCTSVFYPALVALQGCARHIPDESLTVAGR